MDIMQNQQENSHAVSLVSDAGDFHALMFPTKKGVKILSCSLPDLSTLTQLRVISANRSSSALQPVIRPPSHRPLCRRTPQATLPEWRTRRQPPTQVREAITLGGPDLNV